MQKINILGVELTDYSLKESLELLEQYTGSGRLNTILYITAPMLVMAGKDEEAKNCIESMDLTLCGDVELFRVSEVQSASRQYEIENRLFLKEFLRRMARENRKLYLLGESDSELEQLRQALERMQSGLRIKGSSILAKETGDIEEIINRINDVAPSAVISRLSHEKQAAYMTEFKPLVNAEVWLGISKDMAIGNNRESIRKCFTDWIYKKIFRRRMSQFRDENEE